MTTDPIDRHEDPGHEAQAYPQSAVIDVSDVMRRVDEEVERRRRSGDLPAEFEERLDQAFSQIVAAHAGGDGLEAAISQAERLMMMSIGAPPTSARPVVGKAVSAAKVGVQRAIAWNLQYVVDQVSGFGAAVVRALRTLQQRIDAHDATVTELSAEVAALRAASEEHANRAEEMSETLQSIVARAFDERLLRLERNMRRMREDIDSGRVGDAVVSGVGADDAAVVTGAAVGGRVAADGATPLGALENAFDYVAFEDEHRGDRDAVIAKQARYVEIFVGAPGPVVDLGCGRGEFLSQLVEAGVDAIGVDLHAPMVAAAAETGLSVEQGEVLDWLAGREDRSLGGVFLGQVIEHLSSIDIVRLVELASDKLADGGRFIAETVNPRSLCVFANALYADPGHVKPVHPFTMKFLLERNGFESVDVLYSSEVPDSAKLIPVPDDVAGAEVINENIARLNGTIWGPQDYAAVGVRLARPDDDG